MSFTDPVDNGIYGQPVTLNGPPQTGEKVGAHGEPDPQGQNSYAAAANGMADLRNQIQAKSAQDWQPYPWTPLNPNDAYPGDEPNIYTAGGPQ